MTYKLGKKKRKISKKYSNFRSKSNFKFQKCNKILLKKIDIRYI